MTKTIKIRPAQPSDAEAIAILAHSFGVKFDENELGSALAFPDSSAYWVALLDGQGHDLNSDPECKSSNSHGRSGVVVEDALVVGFVAARALGPNQPRLVGLDWLLIDRDLDSSDVIVAAMRLLEMSLGDMPATVELPAQTSPVVLQILNAHGFQKTGKITSNPSCAELTGYIR
ncbi:hypothetical protein [Arcanobacterium ihumii]|uniref:hypothetical protein n=1 Tax=Arcanobacterium ihumii TaxID=2138162 RepID=UPI000F52CDF2|nr:hypothetical protein [Arcanobacterium ihumii]